MKEYKFKYTSYFFETDSRVLILSVIAKNIDRAEDKLKESLKDIYCGNYFHVDSAILYPQNDNFTVELIEVKEI